MQPFGCLFTAKFLAGGCPLLTPTEHRRWTTDSLMRPVHWAREGALTETCQSVWLLPTRHRRLSATIKIDGDCTMRDKRLRVRIVGGGTGGLCLAQGLKQNKASLKNMERFHAKGILARSATKALFRAIDHVPPLKAAFLGR
jgi:hypothetical protein